MARVALRRCGMRMPAFMVAGLLALALGTAAAAATESTTALQLCGTLKEHHAATSTNTGSLILGTRTWVIATGVQAGNAGVEVAPGRELCVQASAGRTSGQLFSYTFFWMPPDGQICGNAVTSSGSATTISADFGALVLTRGSGVAAPQPGQRVCYAVEIVRPAGDVVAIRSQPVDTNNEREWASRCGTIHSYTRATAASSGFIEVGSKGYSIASGVTYTGDPAGDRTDRTAVGSNMCLTAILGDAGDIIEYLTSSMSTQTGGHAAEYAPPADGRPAVVVLSYRTHFELKVPAPIADTTDLARGSYCYTVGVDTAGDLTATALIACPTGGVTGPAPSATPTAAAPPSPAASPTPIATPTPTVTTTPVAATSPTPAASPIEPIPATTGRPQSDSAPAFAAAFAVAALAAAAAAWLIARRH